MYENILLPIDRGYDSNEKSAKEAIKFAKAFGSNIHVLYVKVYQDNRLKNKEEIEPIENMRHFFKNQSQINNINYIVTEGKPIDEICNFVTEENIDLIIMATHSRGWLGKFTLGSLTDETIQNASCPVLTMTHDI
jgi:nucleotide-binding universal stress UspA family protein